MANFKAFPVSFAIYCFCVLFVVSLFVYGLDANDEEKKVYIVYMGSVPDEYSITSDHHLGILQQVLESSSTAEESLIRSYRRSFNGFAAKLTDKERENLKSMKELVSVFPSEKLRPQTTRSWDFIGLPKSAPSNQSAESDIIIGVIDTGIWPHSPSFSDEGFAPPPKKWKGVCERGCNNKLIGIRTYARSPGDEDIFGHGTHMASIAAGRKVDGVSFYGLAQGSARGAVPSARIASYKVCTDSCSEDDVLAALDDAIADGVDLIVVSLAWGGDDLFESAIAIGAFHAMEKGILTVKSVSNYENYSQAPFIAAPWLFNVAASSIDRRIHSKVVLGNGATLIGDSINTFTMKGDKFPLAYGRTASSTCDEERTKECFLECMDPDLVKGKIVVCDHIGGWGSYNNEAKEAISVGAVGLLALTDANHPSAIYPLPTVGLRKHEYDALQSYLNSTKSPVAKILKSEATKDYNAPTAFQFFPRGPTLMPDILKPDITAPGVEILAAFPPTASVSNDPDFDDKRSVNYCVLSGTSVSSAHTAGAAAFLKSLHPDWSPAAIKSALMTTARPMNPSTNPGGEFAYGSGFIDPMKARNPGLVYEATKDDFIRFLCKSGYNESQIRLVSGDFGTSCPKKIDNSRPKDVNYPSMSSMVDVAKPFSVKFHRIVTNVGPSNSTYMAKIESGPKIKVTVKPSLLSFKSMKEQKSFEVTVVSDGILNGSHVSASLTWSDGRHSVRVLLLCMQEVEWEKNLPVLSLNICCNPCLMKRMSYPRNKF